MQFWQFGLGTQFLYLTTIIIVTTMVDDNVGVESSTDLCNSVLAVGCTCCWYYYYFQFLFNLVLLIFAKSL